MVRSKMEFDKKEVNRFIRNAKEAYLIDLLEQILVDLEKIKNELGLK